MMSFPPPHIHDPKDSHTHTVILLHGRGSNGPEFAGDLFSSTTSNNLNLPSRLPSWRWVFPTSRHRHDTCFQETICAWFDAHSLTNIHERQELQVEGLRESVMFILDLIEQEIKLLGGCSRCLFVGGMSQGMATALWAWLCVSFRLDSPLGGVLAFCGWLPFARQIESYLASASLPSLYGDTNDGCDGPQSMGQVGEGLSQYLFSIIGQTCAPTSEMEPQIVQQTPVYLSHGVDDPFVDVDLGRQASAILSRLGVIVDWREYEGADNEGHWIKEPEGFDDIVRWLERCSTNK